MPFTARARRSRVKQDAGKTAQRPILGGEGGKAAAGTTNDWVHAHPWSTIGVVSGIGFALGLVIGRR
ncbi:MAG: glycine zipper domain-containing protein [Burkholderiaceae bacterium]